MSLPNDNCNQFETLFSVPDFSLEQKHNKLSTNYMYKSMNSSLLPLSYELNSKAAWALSHWLASSLGEGQNQLGMRLATLSHEYLHATETTATMPSIWRLWSHTSQLVSTGQVSELTRIAFSSCEIILESFSTRSFQALYSLGCHQVTVCTLR